MLAKTVYLAAFSLFILLPHIVVTNVTKKNAEARFLTSSPYLGTVDGKSFYFQSQPQMKWYEAKEFCIASGMQLASMNSTAQINLIKSAYNYPTFHGQFWTAGRDAMTAAQFVWDTTGESAATTITLGASPGLNSCIFYHTHGPNEGDFHGVPCDIPCGVLCEIVHENNHKTVL